MQLTVWKDSYVAEMTYYVWYVKHGTVFLSTRHPLYTQHYYVHEEK